MTEQSQRLNDILARTAAEALSRTVGGRDFLITIESARVAPNRSSAHFYVRVLPQEREEEAKRMLRASLPAIQQYLNQRLRMRHVPKAYFEFESEGKGVGETKRLLDELDHKYGDDAL